MPHSYNSCLMHYVFSTKNRERFITPEIRLWPFIVGIARENAMSALAVGGIEDHIHVLISLPATLSVSKGIQLIKGGSSKWVNRTFGNSNFEWQEGYGAFSVSVSGVPATIKYINNQAAHHKKTTFQEEFRSFLKKHGIKFDERYVWG